MGGIRILLKWITKKDNIYCSVCVVSLLTKSSCFQYYTSPYYFSPCLSPLAQTMVSSLYQGLRYCKMRLDFRTHFASTQTMANIVSTKLVIKKFQSIKYITFMNFDCILRKTNFKAVYCDNSICGCEIWPHFALSQNATCSTNPYFATQFWREIRCS